MNQPIENRPLQFKFGTYCITCTTKLIDTAARLVCADVMLRNRIIYSLTHSLTHVTATCRVLLNSWCCFMLIDSIIDNVLSDGLQSFVCHIVDLRTALDTTNITYSAVW